MAVRSSAPRRHAARPSRAVAQRIHHPPAALRGRPEALDRSTPTCRAGAAPTTPRTSSSTRRSIPTPGTQLRLGARPLPGRQDQHLGTAGAAPLRLRLQGEEPRRLRRGLADLLPGHRALLRPGRSVPRDLRRQGEPAAPARQHLPAADPAQRRGGHAAQLAEEDGPRAHALSRGRDHRRAEAQQVSQPLLRTRRVHPARRRMRHPRGVRLADRPDLPGDGHRQPDAADQRDRARDPGRQRDRQGARRRLRRHRERTQLRGAGAASSSSPPRRSSRRGCCCSRSRPRIRTASATRAATSATTSASTSWGRASPGWSRIGSASRGPSTTGGPAGSTCRASATSPSKHPNFIRGYGFEGGAGTTMFPGNAHDTPGFGAAYKKTRPRLRRRVHQHGRLRRGAAALREPASSSTRR